MPIQSTINPNGLSSLVGRKPRCERSQPISPLLKSQLFEPEPRRLSSGSPLLANCRKPASLKSRTPARQRATTNSPHTSLGTPARFKPPPPASSSNTLLAGFSAAPTTHFKDIVKCSNPVFRSEAPIFRQFESTRRIPQSSRKRERNSVAVMPACLRNISQKYFASENPHWSEILATVHSVSLNSSRARPS
jgi:hypothetical protein